MSRRERHPDGHGRNEVSSEHPRHAGAVLEKPRPVSRHATVTKMPGTNRDADVLIPEVWIEYEDGTTKPLELEGLH